MTITTAVAVWGAVLSTILAIAKLVGFFQAQAVHIATSYYVNSLEGDPDIIEVVNLTPRPLQVSHWELKWKRRLPSALKESYDITPEPFTTGFRLDGHGKQVLYFDGADKLYTLSNPGMDLILTLHFYGRTKPRDLLVHSST